MSSENQNDTYNKSGFYTFIAAMVITFGFFIYITFLHPGVQLGKIEVSQDAQNKIAEVSGANEEAFDVTTVAEPWTSSEGLIGHGKKVYATNCAFCHGNTGMGDGVAGATLNPKPRDLVAGDWSEDGSLIGLHKTISKGITGTGMAAFGHLPNVDRWAMVHFIQSITKNKIDSKKADLEAYIKE